MIVDNGNEAHVHHALLYECQDLSQAALDWQGDCSYDVTMPLDLKGCNGGSPIAGWAIGGEDFWLPPNVGIRFGKTGGRFMLLETHYDNPDQLEGIIEPQGARRRLYRRWPPCANDHRPALPARLCVVGAVHQRVRVGRPETVGAAEHHSLCVAAARAFGRPEHQNNGDPQRQRTRRPER